jgi:uroporphyrinogen-III synthase
MSQGEALCAQLRKLNYTVDHVSVMEVEALNAPEQQLQIEKKFSRITTYHGIILVSINAAEQALPWLKKYPHARTTKILSVGKTTASYYNANHVHDSRVIYPRQNMSSEGLLAMHELQPDEVKGRRYLILRGMGGRELIAETLKARGAHVDSCELYRRFLPAQNAPLLKKCLPDVDTIIVNSGEALENLVNLAGEQTPFEKLLVVPSERVLEAARTSGFRHIIRALNATDEAVIEALKLCCE